MNFTHTYQQIWILWVEIHLYLQVKCQCSCNDLTKLIYIYKCSTTFPVLMFQISCMCDNFCKQMTSDSVTTSQTNGKCGLWIGVPSFLCCEKCLIRHGLQIYIAWTHGFFLQISKSLSLTEHNVNPKETIFIHITNNYYFPTNGFHIYLSSLSISINSNMSIHLSSSGMWRANMDTGSSQSILQPRMSDSFRAWTCRDWLGTRAHWWGFKHCTLSLGGNCSKRRKQLMQ